MDQKVHHTKTLSKQKIIDDYKTFLRFPTIGGDSSKKKALQDCASWLSSHLRSIGLSRVQVYQTKKHPIVYAEYLAHSSYKTILFYGHYDVQPVVPLNHWKNPPFDPQIAGDYMYARGASDDKGQMFIHVKAIEYMIRNKGDCKVNIKCLFEGEEEIGSPSLPAFMQQYKNMLGCHVAVVSDMKMLSVNRPAITYSVRGSLNAELTIRGHAEDLHSGNFGGIVQNPADVLSQIISMINSDNGKIKIPGFYADVLEITEDEKRFMRASGPSDEILLNEARAKKSWGEPGYSNYERSTIRPSLAVSTLQAGHIGEGCNNIIPSMAIAKFNMRLVKDQSPGKIEFLFGQFIKQQIPKGFTYTIKYGTATKPVEVARNHPYLKAAANAYAKAFAVAPVFIRCGGSIPVVSLLVEQFNCPVVMMGFAVGRDNMHAPNERFYLPNLFRGIQTSIFFIKNISSFNKAK